LVTRAGTHIRENQWFENIVTGVFTPVLAKHTKSFNLIDTLAVGADRIQRGFEPMRRQVDDWRHAQIGPRRTGQVHLHQLCRSIAACRVNATSHPTCQQHWIASESAWLGNLRLPQPGFWRVNRVRTLRQQPNHSDLAHKEFQWLREEMSKPA
jgi:hypothetical protein